MNSKTGTYRIIIKNMVCRRCLMAVEELLKAEGITPLAIDLGVVTLAEPLSEDKEIVIKQKLLDLGFEWVEDKRMRMMEMIRTAVIEFVRDDTDEACASLIRQKPQISDFLQARCGREYSALSKLFSEVRGVTIEHYAMEQRIERVKELLFYDELTVSEIAFRLGYSSVAHLSSQFKSLTGMTPTQFKKIKEHRLTGIDSI